MTQIEGSAIDLGKRLEQIDHGRAFSPNRKICVFDELRVGEPPNGETGRRECLAHEVLRLIRGR
ncbi:MAG: hypothetical protein H6682_04555 [Candidatus Eisenbacteria bacterium]|nr:hypothetical protein [Candidatus Eisenbacteria bacterium]